MTVAYGINIVGNLTNNQGILSGFSSGNYAELPFNFCPAKTPYEIVLKFNCSNVSGDQILLLVGDWREYYGMIDIQLTNNKICAEINATDTMGNATTTLSANTDYWVKFTYDGVSEYNLYLSTNGISFNLEDTLQSSLYLNSNNPMPSWIGINDDEDTCYLNGSIDLNESYIKLNGSYVWKGVASTSNVRTRIQLRHDTAANWASVNPVLLEGEVGIETNTRKQKFGDGSTSWNNLPYDANSTALNSKANTDLSNLSSIGKAVIDGQWINRTAQNIVNGSNITWTSGHNYDLSSYLPNDGHVYEVIFTASWTGSTAGSSHELRASTDIITSVWNWLGRVAGQNGAAGTCIMPVGTGRYVKLVTGAKACNSVYFSALGYRRLGTNS